MSVMPLKLKSGALTYVIGISLLLFILLGLALTYSMYKHQQATLFFKEKQYEDLIDDTISFLEQTPGFIAEKDTGTLDLYDTERLLVRYKRENWGLFDKYTLSTSWKFIEMEKVFLLGDDINNDSLPSLYMKDYKRPLTVGGDTWLGNNCFIPSLGAKKIYIKKTRFKYDKPIQGDYSTSENKLPPLRDDIVERVKGMEDTNDPSFIMLPWLAENKTYKNSFTDPTILFHSGDTLKIADGKYEGNIIFHSSDFIFIRSGAEITDCILYAPSIEVEDGFKGSVQLFATQNIVVNKSCKLNYPSFIVVVSDEKEIGIKVDEGTDIKGGIILYNTSSLKNKKVNLEIGSKAKIEGTVYSSGATEFKGELSGSIYADKFFLRSGSNIYDDLLFDVKIDIDELPDDFTGISTVEKPGKRKFLRWLY